MVIYKWKALVFNVSLLKKCFTIKSFRITVHYIDNNFQNNFGILSTSPLRGSHNSENITSEIKKTLTNAKIEFSKIHLIVRDSAAVMKKACFLLDLESFDCFLHKMNLVQRHSKYLILDLFRLLMMGLKKS